MLPELVVGVTNRDPNGQPLPDRPKPTRRPSMGPRPILRKLGGPLLLYHILILAGAYLVVLGIIDGSPLLQVVGVVSIVAGVVTEAAVLAWSAQLVRRAASAKDGSDRETAQPAEASSLRGQLCVRCGWSGRDTGHICPRCAGLLVLRFDPTGGPPPK